MRRPRRSAAARGSIRRRRQRNLKRPNKMTDNREGHLSLPGFFFRSMREDVSMTTISLYRTLPLAFVAAAILFATGCDDMMKKHDALKEESYGRWNMTRMAVMYQLAEQQYEVGDYDKCKKTMEDAMALKTPYGPLQTLAGKVEIEKGSLELAASYLKEGARLDPTNPEPLYLLGIVYQRWQKNDVAADYYQQAWDRKPSEALYMLAVAEMKITLGQLD